MHAAPAPPSPCDEPLLLDLVPNCSSTTHRHAYSAIAPNRANVARRCSSLLVPIAPMQFTTRPSQPDHMRWTGA